MDDRLGWFHPRYFEITEKVENFWSIIAGGQATWSDIEKHSDWLKEVVDERKSATEERI